MSSSCDTYTLLAGILIVFLANLPKTQSQGNCNFYYENNGTVTTDTISQDIPETQAQDSTILSLITSPGSLTCDPNDPNSPVEQYLSYSHLNSKLEFRMKQAFGSDFDEGNVDQFFFTFCILTCEDLSILKTVTFKIVPENTNTPVFDHESAEFTLDENCPFGLDISDLLTTDEQLLTVTDMDLPYDPQANVIFSVSNPSFKILESRVIYYTDSKDKNRVRYQPRIAVKSQLDAAEKQIKFDLIATDRGIPPKESRFPITVNLVPHDLRDPEFEEPFYTSVIESAEYTGVLKVLPDTIRASDGDKALNAKLNYRIVSSGNLKVNLIASESGEVQLDLTASVGEQDNKSDFIVIEAVQEDNPSRTRTVVVFVELPVRETTTTTTTSTSTPLTTCQPCTTPFETTTSSSTSTNPTTTIPSCAPCQECTTTPSCAPCQECTTTPSETTCPTINPETDCPATTGTDSCSTAPTVTCPDCPIVTCPSCSTVTCPTLMPVTCPESPECPIVTCPSTVSTSVTCAPCTDTSPNTAITCPTSTTPSGKPTVNFEKEQYWSEVIENSPIDTYLLTLAASSSSNEEPEYDLIESLDKKYFTVDTKSGVVRVAQSLPIGTYNLQAIAKIPSGAEDLTRVVVSAVRGTSCIGTQFSSPLYSFSSEENYVGTIGQVDLRTTEGDYYNGLEITSCDPSSMIGYFSVSDDGTVAVITPFNRTISDTRVILTISAVNKLKSFRAVTISTLVHVEVLYINQSPQFIENQPVVVGYPQRTYLDSTVLMPIFTPKAYDADDGENGSLAFDLSESSPNLDQFDIDFRTGSLFFKTNSVDKVPETDRSIQITAKDKYGQAAFLDVVVKPLRDDFISVMEASSGLNALIADTVSSDLSRIMPYKVTVLRMEKSYATRATGFDYSIVAYAVKDSGFVSRSEFERDIKVANVSSLDWTLKTDIIFPPAEYEAEKIIRETSKDLDSYIVATAVLASLLGLTFVLVVAYLVYLKKWKNDEPSWDNALRAASLDVDKKQWDKRSLSESNILDHEANQRVDSYNRELLGERVEDVPQTVIRFSQEKVVIDKEQIETPTPPEEPYCPPSPIPKKGILKDPSTTDAKTIQQKTDRDKKTEDSGVSFNPTPEVIEVPVILSESLSEESKSNLLVEEL